MKIFQSKYYRKDADDQLWLIIGFRVIFPVSFVKNYSGHAYFKIFNALHAQQNAKSLMVWTEKKLINFNCGVQNIIGRRLFKVAQISATR